MSTEPPKKTESIWRHPLATMLVGFLLTGVVGTFLTNHFAERRQQDTERTRQRDLRQKAVLDLSRLFSERITRAEMVAAALERRGAAEVISRLKQLYDEAEANWLLSRQQALVLVREILGAADYEWFRRELETRLGRNRMLALRDCLDRACTETLTGGDGLAVWRQCHGAELLKGCRPCAETVLEALYDLASVSHYDREDPRAGKVRAQARHDLERACP